MTVTTTTHIRKPIYVEAVRVTAANFDEITTWCQGEVQREEIPGKGAKKYIRVRVPYPKNPRQTKAFVGDWVLYTEKGYKVYTNKAFHESFDEVRLEDKAVSPGNCIMGSEELLPGLTVNEAVKWLREQPELTTEQIGEFIKTGKCASTPKIEKAA